MRSLVTILTNFPMKSKRLLLWARLSLLCGLGHSATNNPDTDWFRDARCGVFMQFLPGDAQGLALVKDFDVEVLAASWRPWVRGIYLSRLHSGGRSLPLRAK